MLPPTGELFFRYSLPGTTECFDGLKLFSGVCFRELPTRPAPAITTASPSFLDLPPPFGLDRFHLPIRCFLPILSIPNILYSTLSSRGFGFPSRCGAVRQVWFCALKHSRAKYRLALPSSSFSLIIIPVQDTLFSFPPTPFTSRESRRSDSTCALNTTLPFYPNFARVFSAARREPPRFFDPNILFQAS